MKKNNSEFNFLNQLLVSILILFAAFKFGEVLSKQLQSKIDKGNE